MNQKNNKKFILPVVILLLSGMFFLEFTSALQESQTVDEGAHLSSGYSYLKTGDFRMNPEHPPLIKELGALPLLFLPLKLPLNHESWKNYNQWEFGRQFLYHNTVDADFILLLGRIPVMLLSLILGVFIYKWTNQLWGSKVALLALVFFVFEPNLLAHSRYLTTDLGLTLFFFLTIYALYNYLHSFSKKHLMVFVLMFGLAQVAKFSALILFPLMIFLFLLKKLHSDADNLSGRRLTNLILILIVGSSIIVFLAYGLETKIAINDLDIKNFYEEQLAVSDRSEFSDEPDFIQKFLTITHPSTLSGKALYSLAQKVPLPAFSYFKGLGRLISHNYWGHLSYLLGRYSYFGFWYYFPVIFLVKTSVPLLILLFVGICYSIQRLIKFFYYPLNKNLNQTNLIGTNKWRRLKDNFQMIIKKLILFYRSVPFYYWVLIFTPVIYFLWAMTSRINIGHRHLLPIYPFLIMLVSKVLTLKPKRFTRLGQGFQILLLIFYLSSTLLIYPNFLTYFNEAAGGPAKGPKYAVDSNIDWGQDLLKLKRYLQDNNIDSIYLTYFGSIDVNYYNINFKSVPTDRDYRAINNLNGVVAISVTALYEENRPYRWLEKLIPDEQIGYSIYLYDLRKQ